jgi:Asp-tRNA(Asn)/Glu-tRNA(Gln) amidotransferase C subunit
MKDTVQRINVEYGLNLTEEEIEIIAKQVEACQQLFQKLYEVDVEGVVPALNINPSERS